MSRSSAKLLIDVFGKLQTLQEGYLEMTISMQALLAASKEAFPNISYQKHYEAAAKSVRVQKIREQLRIAAKNIEATKKALLEESN